MESYIKTNTIINSKRKFFTNKDIGNILQIKNIRTRENTVRKLNDSKILTQLEKDKYILTKNTNDELEISQYIYTPSYISLETALNTYGILNQIPFEITAITLKKSLRKEILGKTYSYSRIQKKLYTGYIKKDNYLIATPEKALLDYLYLSLKSIKSKSYLDEMDLSRINRKRLNTYLKLFDKKTKDKISLIINKYI